LQYAEESEAVDRKTDTTLGGHGCNNFALPSKAESIFRLLVGDHRRRQMIMGIEITSFRKYQKNSLQGFVSLYLTNAGVEVRDCTLHRSEGKKWIHDQISADSSYNHTFWFFHDGGDIIFWPALQMG
jgi:hypothetical protein